MCQVSSIVGTIPVPNRPLWEYAHHAAQIPNGMTHGETSLQKDAHRWLLPLISTSSSTLSTEDGDIVNVGASFGALKFDSLLPRTQVP